MPTNRKDIVYLGRKKRAQTDSSTMIYTPPPPRPTSRGNKNLQSSTVRLTAAAERGTTPCNIRKWNRLIILNIPSALTHAHVEPVVKIRRRLARNSARAH